MTPSPPQHTPEDELFENKLLSMWHDWERGDWYAPDGAEDKYNDRAFRDAIVKEHEDRITKAKAEAVEEVLDELEAQSITVLPETYPTCNRRSIDAVPLSVIASKRTPTEKENES